MTVKQLQLISAVGLIISIIFHLLAVLQVYYLPGHFVFVIFAGLLIVWLQTSKLFKEVLSRDQSLHPWKTVIGSCPAYLKYMTYFFIVYALVNFLMSLSFVSGAGYLDMDVDPRKLRLISGFWMPFYALGLAVSSSASAGKEDGE